MDRRVATTLRLSGLTVATVLCAGLLARIPELPRRAPLATPAPAATPPAAKPTGATQTGATQTAATPAAAAPAATPPAAVPAIPTLAADPAGRSDGFAIQLGSFRDPDNAAPLVRLALQAGFAPAMLDHIASDGRIWHTLLLGHYPDQATATRFATALRQQAGVSGIVVAAPAAPAHTAAPAAPAHTAAPAAPAPAAAPAAAGAARAP